MIRSEGTTHETLGHAALAGSGGPNTADVKTVFFHHYGSTDLKDILSGCTQKTKPPKAQERKHEPVGIPNPWMLPVGHPAVHGCHGLDLEPGAMFAA